MTRRFLSAFISLALVVPVAFAQRSHTPPTPAQQVENRVARLTALLMLSTPQQTAATAYFTTEQTALATISASMKTARTALNAAVEANSLGDIGNEATAIGNLTTQEVQATATANAAFYALLTPTQQTQYNKLGGLGRGGGGFGGFGGRGRRN